jgi:hypothetical protein
MNNKGMNMPRVKEVKEAELVKVKRVMGNKIPGFGDSALRLKLLNYEIVEIPKDLASKIIGIDIVSTVEEKI